MTIDFYCNKRFDISFSDFHRLIKLILPTDYFSEETRGIYKRDYQPCNIIELYQRGSDLAGKVANIYCWLGQKGLTVLADNAIGASICLEVLKNVKQNPEDFRMLSYTYCTDSQDYIDKENQIINAIASDKSILIYKQIYDNAEIHKYIIREYNGDEVQLDFHYEQKTLRLSGAVTSLFTLVQLSIAKHLNDDTQINSENT